jgi:DNA-binding CsgD family transcriptional regulator
MSKSGSLRVVDVRNAFRLIGDCRDLGHDPDRWHQRLFDGLNQLIGCSSATGGEGIWLRPREPPKPMTSFDVGFDETARALFLAFMRDGCVNGDPILREIQPSTARLVTCTRRHVVSDREWYASIGYNEYRKPSRIDDQLTSVFRVGEQSAINAITAHRPLRDHPFSMRERNLLDFFHRELGQLIGGALVSGLEPGPEGLSRRLRQTLICLIEGDSEKQVAARLGLSQATTHQYVTSLYRFFDGPPPQTDWISTVEVLL